ncbi:hypothetical protein EDC63_104159 [Sulfurirhabdus autotrophica]|uniref:Uncharacterized protein n=1 Tax=Sulfurirhabdus autotrophica TaxID=1706046 RepID=A0A4R3Y941_9PROT|nr:hypothetical protein EDC63_104159 [Sulfurirhabdus autotrophica]
MQIPGCQNWRRKIKLLGLWVELNGLGVYYGYSGAIEFASEHEIDGSDQTQACP